MYNSIQSYRHLVLQKSSTSTDFMRCDGILLAHYDIFIPKANILLVVIFFITESKGILQYGCKDTLNSKIHQLVIILL